MKHRDKILELRKQGLSYSMISDILGCSKSTISFHCSTDYLKNKYKKKDKPVIQKRVAKKIKKERILLTRDEYITAWKNGEVSGGKGDASGHGKVSNHVRKYLFDKYDSKCAKCKWSELNIFTNTIPLEVEHIDGNPMNHKEENLTLLCPNCHSLTKGHSTSKGNGRRYYREKYRKEVGIKGIEPNELQPPVLLLKEKTFTES